MAQIPNLIVNFWTLYLRRLSMKLEKLIVFMRYRSKMTILDRIYLSQIRMRAYSTLKDAVFEELSFHVKFMELGRYIGGGFRSSWKYSGHGGCVQSRHIWAREGEVKRIR